MKMSQKCVFYLRIMPENNDRNAATVASKKIYGGTLSDSQKKSTTLFRSNANEKNKRKIQIQFMEIYREKKR